LFDDVIEVNWDTIAMLLIKKNYYILCAIGLIALLGSIPATFAQPKTLNSLQQAKDLSDKVMDDAMRGNYRHAFERFRPHWTLKPEELESAIKKIQEGIKLLNKRFGKPIGYQLMKTKKGDDFLVRYVYVMKYQRALVRWNFTYYKPKNRWIVLSVTFDDGYAAFLK
jgi:hypothetical protein